MCRKLVYLVSFVLVLSLGLAAEAGLPEWEAAISASNPFHWYKFNETTGPNCLDYGTAKLNGTYDSVSLGVQGFFGAATAAGFSRTGANRVNFTGATALPGPWTVEYIVKTTKPPAANDSQALHDSDSTSIRLAGWTALGEAGFTQYGVADYRFTPTTGLTLNNLVVQQDVWMHLVWRNDGSGTQLFFNGKLVGTSTNTIELPRLRIGARGAGPADHLQGVLDEAVVYNRALTNMDIIAHARAASLIDESIFKAARPSPPDGATGVSTPLLQWTAGETAKWHDVYFGTNPTPGAGEFVGRQMFTMYWHGPGLIPGTTYCWRVDEVEADGTTIYAGNVWSFTAAPVTAYNPDPPDGAKYVSTDADLSWTAGVGAVTHDVYLGTNQADVAAGTAGTFKGNQPTTKYDPGTLAKSTRYYWRIDEVKADRTTKHTGEVWSFSTIPDIPITDPNLVGWWKLDEGRGTIALDWSGHDNDGTLVGDPQWAAGQLGLALAFEGSRVAIRASDSLTADLFRGSFTLAAWINPKRTGNTWQQIFRSIRADGSSNDTLFINNDGRLSWRGRVGGGWAGGMCETASNVVPADQWTHVAVVGDGTNFRIYVNAALSQESAFRTTDGTNASYYIGGDPTTSGESYRGMIDDVRVYHKVLTAEEIKQTMRGDPTLAWNPKPVDRSTTDVEKAVPLTWTPGEKAAKHDIYLGTDQTAVEDADASDTTGIYRGRQDANSYTPPGGVEFGKTYYWRIDEFNTDGTISKGTIWSFNVAEYLIVDNFEEYDDVVNRIFDAWADYAVNNTGATIGYFDPPFAEQTVVHSGSQSMPYRYDNDGTVNEGTSYEKSGTKFYSEAEREWTVPQDWTRKGVKSLTLWFRGLPGTLSSFTGTDPYTMTAGGGDIWGTADHFHYVFKSFSGGGSIAVRVDSLTMENPHVWAKAGVMIRESLDPGSVQAMMIATPSNRVQFARRDLTGGTSEGTDTGVDSIRLPYWVKLTRQANTFTASHSTDGVNWQTLGSAEIMMGSNVLIGLALTSQRDATRIPITAVFSNVTISGSATGQWQSQDIGLTYNATEPLYVVLQDSANKSAVVTHSDPAATLLATWTEWNIPLTPAEGGSDPVQGFALAGVNLRAIKKLSIGVGDRANPQRGGSGRLYIDDIQLRLPPPAQ